jgi:hypothetical protein
MFGEDAMSRLPIMIHGVDLKASDATGSGKRSGRLVLKLPGGAHSRSLIGNLDRLGGPK